jgi:hypothetical protein
MRRITLIALVSMAAFAQTPGGQPKSYASPDEAVKALIDAASKDDTQALVVVLGPSAKGIMTSGNASQDTEERQEFSKLAAQKNHIEHSSMSSKTAILLVGNEDWPFPIPLTRTGQQWHFDPEAGAMEMRARKIGADELDAIEICKGYVGAQQAYAAQQTSGKGAVAYAQKIASSLQVPEGFAKADVSSAGASRKPYHGYYFRVLKEQGSHAPGGAHRYVMNGAMIGGFGLIAWPAEYGASGIHAFIVNQDGLVYEKDLGARTGSLVGSIVSYDPDDSWTLVD